MDLGPGLGQGLGRGLEFGSEFGVEFGVDSGNGTPLQAGRTAADAGRPARSHPPPGRPRLTSARTWTRTALALLAGAFAVIRLTGITPHALRLALGGYLIALSAGVTVAGYVQWRARQARMRQRQPLGGLVNPTVLTAALLVLAGFVVAVIAFTS